MWNVDIVTREHGKGPLKPDEVEHGFLTINDHKKVSRTHSAIPILIKLLNNH